MKPKQFLKTIYLGDRFCTKFVIDGYNNQVEIHLNSISRIRDITGKWNYYTDEDIENGAIVITDIKEVKMDESGLLPNDQIYSINTRDVEENLFEYVIEASNVNKDALTTDLKITVVGKDIYLYNPSSPDKKIID